MNNFLFQKDLILGTALWGWGIDKSNALTILDNFVEDKICDELRILIQEATFTTIKLDTNEKDLFCIEKDGSYFMQKDDSEEEIDYQTFRINTFVSEFLEL